MMVKPLFAPDQQSLMESCMLKIETHAIQLTTITVPRPDGQFDIRVHSLACVEAPGFREHWLTFFGR
jgi:hypothetical protein